MLNTRVFPTVLLAAATVLLATPAAFAQKQTKKPATTAKPLTAAQAVIQVDGITNGVIDRLWEATDHYWHDGDYNRIVALVRLVVEADPGFTEGWESAAWLLWSMGDNPGADALVTYGLEQNPNKSEMHNALGWQFKRTKRFAEALPHFESAVKYPDATLQMWKNLAHTYEDLGRLDDCIKTWEQIVTKFSNDPVGLVNLERVKKVKAARANQL